MSVMHHPELASMKIASESDAKTYLGWLAKNNLNYHLDDCLDDIIWNGTVKKPTESDIDEMKRLGVEMWLVTNPWLLFEWDRDLWKYYTGQES